MFGSLRLSTVPKLPTSRVQVDPRSGTSTFQLMPSTIKLDFDGSIVGGSGTKKRSSFLPSDFDDGDLSRSTSRFKYISGSTADYKGDFRADSVYQRNFAMRTFLTGSKYVGEFNWLGMSGKGIYKYPHGVIYDGHFNKKGEFHGTGSLIYPGGQRVEGVWKNGKLASTGANFVASDNSKYESSYCRMPDRRFQIELDFDVQPAEQEYLTNSEAPRVIPPGMYDTGYGFYDPKRKVVIDYEDPEKFVNLFDMVDDERRLLYETLDQHEDSEESLTDVVSQSKTKFIDNMIMHVIAIPPMEKEKWVKANCRKAWDEVVGYRPDLYEVWNAGYRRENLEVTRELARLSHSKADALINKFSQLEQKTTDLYSFTLAKIEHHRKLQVNTLKDLIIPKDQQTRKKRKRGRKAGMKRSGHASTDGSTTPVSFTSDVKSIIYNTAPKLDLIEKL